MSTTRQYKVGAIFSYVQVVLNIVLSLFMLPFTIGMLGKETYDIYQAITKTVGFMFLMDFGLGNAVTRYVSKYRTLGKKDEMERFLGMVLGLYGIIALIIAAIAMAGYGLLPLFYVNFTPAEMGLAQRLFAVMSVGAIFSLLCNVFPGTMAAYERFALLKIISVLRLLLRTVLAVLLLLRTGDAFDLVLLDTALSLVFALIQAYLVIFRLGVKVKFQGFDRPLLKEIFRYTFFVFLNMVMYNLYWGTDAIILGRINKAAVTITTIGGGIATYFMDFSNALSGLMLPKATKMVTNGADREDLTDLMIRVGRLQLMVIGLMVVGYVFVGLDFMRFWVGKTVGAEYWQGYVIGLILMLGLTIPLFQSAGISIIEALNRHAFRAAVLAGISVLNVVLTVFLARAYGAIGAAAATAFALLVGNVGIINWYYHKKIGLNIPRFFREVLRGLFPALMVACGFAALTLLIPKETWLHLLLCIVLIAVTYVGSVVTIGMNISERQLIFSGLRRLKRRA